MSGGGGTGAAWTAWAEDGALDQARTLADTLADEALAGLAACGPLTGGTDFPAALGQAAGDPQAPAAARLACRRFLAETAAPPAWFDPGQIAQGQRIFVRHSALSVTALLLGGLIDSHSNVHIARLLAATGRLTQDTGRRMFDTARMVHDVMLPRSLEPGGAGHRRLLGVRLVHAGIRRKVLGSGRWQESWGCPINQEDMVFTLLTLSLSVSAGLQRLGVHLAAEERQAYYHLWRCAGWLLGIDERLLPAAEAEAQALYARIAERHCHPDENSRRLTRSILDSMALRPPLFLPRAALAQLVRLMLGEPLADAMALPRSAVWDRLLTCACPAIALLSWIQQRGSYLEGISLAWGWRYAEWNLRYGLRSRR